MRAISTGTVVAGPDQDPGTIWSPVFTVKVQDSRCVPLVPFHCVLQASTASDKTTAPRRLVETGPSVCRWRTATSARVHPALRGRIARTTSTNATGTRADTAPARTFTDPTSKSNDIVNGPLPAFYISSLNVNCSLTPDKPDTPLNPARDYDFAPCIRRHLVLVARENMAGDPFGSSSSEHKFLSSNSLDYYRETRPDRSRDRRDSLSDTRTPC